MKNLFKVVTVFAALALLVGTMVALSVSATEGDQSGVAEANVTATATATGATEVFYGDANDDGLVNMKDVLTIRKHLATIEVKIDLAKADANNDGVVDMKDVLVIRKYLVQMIDTLPYTEE